MTGIDNGIKITFRHGEQEEPYKTITKSLLGFTVWFERMKLQAEKVVPNGMQGVIIITKTRYIEAHFC